MPAKVIRSEDGRCTCEDFHKHDCDGCRQRASVEKVDVDGDVWHLCFECGAGHMSDGGTFWTSSTP